MAVLVAVGVLRLYDGCCRCRIVPPVVLAPAAVASSVLTDGSAAVPWVAFLALHVLSLPPFHSPSFSSLVVPAAGETGAAMAAASGAV